MRMTPLQGSLVFGAFLAGFLFVGDVYAACVAANAVGGTFQGRQITDGFGTRGDYGVGNSTFHKGYDLSVSGNPTVGAFFGGTVEVRQQTSGGQLAGYGNYAIVTNGNMRAVYAHAGNLSVTNGQTISSGDTLGNWSSCTGSCTGPHLHFEYQVQDSSGNWVKVDPGIAQGLLNSGVDPQSADFAAQAIQQTADGCNVDPSVLNSGSNGAGTGTSVMCDPNIRARVTEQVQVGTQMMADFKATVSTMPRPLSEVANTPCMSNELQRISNQFAYAPSMYAANILGQLNGLAGPVSGLMNKMLDSLFTSFTNAANMNPLANQFTSFAQTQISSIFTSLGLGGAFSSALCGMMVDMVLKYVQCVAPIKLPSLGQLTGSLNDLLPKGCAGAALTSALYAAGNSSALQSLAQPITVPSGGLFSTSAPTLGVAPGVADNKAPATTVEGE